VAAAIASATAVASATTVASVTAASRSRSTSGTTAAVARVAGAGWGVAHSVGAGAGVESERNGVPTVRRSFARASDVQGIAGIAESGIAWAGSGSWSWPRSWAWPRSWSRAGILTGGSNGTEGHASRAVRTRPPPERNSPPGTLFDVSLLADIFLLRDTCGPFDGFG